MGDLFPGGAGGPHGRHAGLLTDGAAEFGGVFEQEQVEARTLHLVGVFHPGHHAPSKLDVPRQRAAVTDVELRAVLPHEAGALHLLPGAGFLQDRVGDRHQRFPDVEAREALLLHDQHPQPRAREVRSGRAAGGAAADDHGVKIRGGTRDGHSGPNVPKNCREVKGFSRANRFFGGCDLV